MTLAEVDEQVLCLPMVETVAALSRIDDICAVPGIDGIYIGPSDLAISLGLSPYAHEIADELRVAIKRIRAACATAGIPVGIHTTSGRQARAYLDAGLNMVTVSTDAAILRAAVASELGAARDTDASPELSGY
jgi:4-hydroxy-2-oxoheptanedioate aldolase